MRAQEKREKKNNNNKTSGIKVEQQRKRGRLKEMERGEEECSSFENKNNKNNKIPGSIY
jgi:hypothetical protein